MRRPNKCRTHPCPNADSTFTQTRDPSRVSVFQASDPSKCMPYLAEPQVDPMEHLQCTLASTCTSSSTSRSVAQFPCQKRHKTVGYSNHDNPSKKPESRQNSNGFDLTARWMTVSLRAYPVCRWSQLGQCSCQLDAGGTALAHTKKNGTVRETYSPWLHSLPKESVQINP